MLCGDSGKFPVNYYYAVTMPAVSSWWTPSAAWINNLELSFSMAGRAYEAARST
jgi:hypothetical protein